MLRKRRRALPVGWLAFAVSISLVIGALSAPAPAYANKDTWFSGFSSIVVDAKTGEVIDSSKADELRHPASLAKVMTLYLLFAELETGRLKLSSKLTASADATKQPPSKLGLKAGESISVEDAIKAIVTRSANDVAVTIAEAVAGDEDSFARMMTQRARALGMTRTVFTNASGLPDADQVTTAREMALLGLAIQDRFPKYYPYFATQRFTWRGVAIGNHNRLLGSVDGVDGIKTGYTRASGFNLISNVKRGGRHIVAVVMGGKTGAARDENMRDLIAAQIRHAHAGPRTTPRFVEAPVPLPTPSPATTTAVRRTVPVPGSDNPIERKTVRVVPVGKNGETISEGDDNDEPSKTTAVHSLSSSTAQTPMPITPAGVAPEGKFVTFAPAPPPPATASASAQTSPEATRAAVLAAMAPEPPVTPAAKQAMAEIEAAVKKPEGWIVQIGAFPTEELARNRLEDARGHAGGLLAKGNPYTETTSRGSTTLYRARFAGFDEATAREACARLKKNDFSCFTTRN